MYINPTLANSPIQYLQLARPGMNPVGVKKGMGSIAQALAAVAQKDPRKHAGLKMDLKGLQVLKNALHHARGDKGPQLSPRARQKRLHGRLGDLAKLLRGRLQHMMNRHRNRGAGKANGTSQSKATQTGGDYSFLDDPKLSMGDKVQLFLMQLIKDSDAKMEELMRKRAGLDKKSGKETVNGTGKSTGKKTGKKERRQAKRRKFLAKFISIGSKIAAVVVSAYATPAAGAAVVVAGEAASKGMESWASKAEDGKANSTTASATDSKTASATDSKTASSKESEERMLMFQLQKLQNHVKEMLNLFSSLTKSEHDLKQTMIRNMA